MAIANLNPLIDSLSGRIEKSVYYKRYSSQCIRSYITPVNPDTISQRAVRSKFADAVKAWQALTNEEKYKYNRKSCNLNMSGYNLFISGYMNRRIQAAAKPVSGANRNYKIINYYNKNEYSDTGMLRIPSVSASNKLQSILNSAKRIRIRQPAYHAVQ